MRILFTSNLFPPHHLSGFEMLCFDVAKSLQARGHFVEVLTSDYRLGNTTAEELTISRVLKLDSDINYYNPLNILRYWPDRWRNVRWVEDAIRRFDPDIVFVWGMWNLSKAVAQAVERMAESRVVYYFADAWPTQPGAHRAYWDATDGNWRSRSFKRMLRLPVRSLLWPEWRSTPLRFEHALCCSQAVRDQILASTVKIGEASIIYEGVELTPFLQVAASRAGPINAKGPSIVYVGRLMAHKGVHTAIQAIKWLIDNPDIGVRPQLTILGKGHPNYEAYLRDLVRTNRLEQDVEFVDPIPRECLPKFLANFEVLVLPSIYEEPLARIMQDGLAAGLIVVATWTGGTKETIVDGQNGLVFLPEDHVGLAQQVLRAARDPDLQARLRAGAVQTAKEKFDLARMTDQIEAYISNVMESVK